MTDQKRIEELERQLSLYIKLFMRASLRHDKKIKELEERIKILEEENLQKKCPSVATKTLGQAKGEFPHSNKISREKQQEIKSLHADGLSVRQIAKRSGVGKSTANKYINE